MFVGCTICKSANTYALSRHQRMVFWFCLNDRANCMIRASMTLLEALSTFGWFFVDKCHRKGAGLLEL